MINDRPQILFGWLVCKAQRLTFFQKHNLLLKNWVRCSQFEFNLQELSMTFRNLLRVELNFWRSHSNPGGSSSIPEKQILFLKKKVRLCSFRRWNPPTWWECLWGKMTFLLFFSDCFRSKYIFPFNWKCVCQKINAMLPTRKSNVWNWFCTSKKYSPILSDWEGWRKYEITPWD